MLMTLGEIASALNLPLKKNRAGLVRQVTTDSRAVRKDGLFIALKGDRFNGRDFVGEAFEKGASAALVQETVPEFPAGTVFRVPDTLLALQDLASYYRDKFLFPVIAVTGTNGKTTTKEMTAAVLSTHYMVLKTEGNFNNLIGLPLSIFGWSHSGELAVVEMGMNHPGEIRQLCDVARPTHGVITNIGKGHLEFMENEAGVARAKAELLESLAERGLAFLNGDDPHLLPYRQTAGKTITFGFDRSCDLVGRDPGYDRFGFPRMTVEGQFIRLSVPGRHNLSNALAAIAVGRAFGIPWAELQEVLWRYKGMDDRMGVLRLAGLVVLNDTYNANPSSMDQALLTLRDMTGLRRRLAVLGDMLELGKNSAQEHGLAGEFAASCGLQALFCTGQGMKQAVEAARRSGIPRAEWFESKTKLIKALLPELADGDGILVKGSRGMKMEEVVRAIQGHIEKRTGE
jgi:UDP-N-acetylmuramoyl-tripeptide--D-alanyl-D-alanine ligase